MKLSVKERFELAALLPKIGSLEEQIRIKSITEKLAITSKEADLIELITVEGKTTWNNNKSEIKEFSFEVGEVNLIKASVKIADEKKVITQSNLELCQRINLL